jgi:ferric-dicitrate binding protein FerR (iron transport regulator)
MTPQVRFELEQLLSALCDGSLTEPDHVRLDSMLNGDGECRRHYLEYVDLHSQLLAAPGLPAGDFTEPSSPPHATPKPRQWRRLAATLALVAATLVVSVLLQILWSQRPRGQRPDGGDGAANALATVAQTSECVWEGPTKPKAGARVGPGELRLTRGLARLHFDGGSDLIIEGPAVLNVDGAAEATLRRGKAVFHGDDTGPPFEFHTALATLVDVGTEYGVEVGDRQEEVHVFNGEVRRTPQGGGEAELIGANEARHYDGTVPGQPAEFDEAKFVRHIRADRPDPDAGLLASEDFNYDDADVMTKGWANGGRGWADPWRAAPPFFKPGTKPPPRQPAINTRQGLSHPSESGPRGCLEYAGFTTFSRRLATPIRLDEEATYYFSFLFRRDRPAPGDFPPTLKVSIKAADEGRFDPQWINRRISFAIGGEYNHLSCSHHGSSSRVPLPLGYEKTHLLVAKIVAHSAGKTEVYVRVYGPDDVVEREETMLWIPTCQPVRSDLTLNWVEIHVNGRRKQQIDELRLGTTWASVTAPWANP